MRQDLDVFQDSLETRERGIIDTFVYGKLLFIEITVGLEACRIDEQVEAHFFCEKTLYLRRQKIVVKQEEEAAEILCSRNPYIDVVCRQLASAHVEDDVAECLALRLVDGEGVGGDKREGVALACGLDHSACGGPVGERQGYLLREQQDFARVESLDRCLKSCSRDGEYEREREVAVDVHLHALGRGDFLRMGYRSDKGGLGSVGDAQCNGCIFSEHARHAVHEGAEWGHAVGIVFLQEREGLLYRVGVVWADVTADCVFSLDDEECCVCIRGPGGCSSLLEVVGIDDRVAVGDQGCLAAAHGVRRGGPIDEEGGVSL